MGLDVSLYAECNPSPQELEAAEAFFATRTDFGDPWNGSVLGLIREEWHPCPRVEVGTTSRYYGPGYERGNWPGIYAAIRILQAAFPGAKVFYGSDSTDDGLECTPELLSLHWQHFLGPDGDNYRRCT